MGSLEQKQTEEWTLLKGWSFVSKMFYREEPALCSSAHSDSESERVTQIPDFGEFSSAAFLYCNGVTESQ